MLERGGVQKYVYKGIKRVNIKHTPYNITHINILLLEYLVSTSCAESGFYSTHLPLSLTYLPGQINTTSQIGPFTTVTSNGYNSKKTSNDRNFLIR